MTTVLIFHDHGANAMVMRDVCRGYAMIAALGLDSEK
jgi:hypothetical protein